MLTKVEESSPLIGKVFLILVVLGILASMGLFSKVDLNKPSPQPIHHIR
jgi:hypothetical protein